MLPKSNSPLVGWAVPTAVLSTMLGFVFRRSPLSPLTPESPSGPWSGERKAQAKNNSPDSQEPSQPTFWELNLNFKFRACFVFRYSYFVFERRALYHWASAYGPIGPSGFGLPMVFRIASAIATSFFRVILIFE